MKHTRDMATKGNPLPVDARSRPERLLGERLASNRAVAPQVTTSRTFVPQQPAGYLDQTYAQALFQLGRPRCMPSSGGWILERSIAGTTLKDGVGCYPLFCCERWDALAEDVRGLNDLVSLVLVTDPFGDYDLTVLQQAFPDLMVPFKAHYVSDLRLKPQVILSEHHKRNIRKGVAAVEVEHCSNPTHHADTWVQLYKELMVRHSITGAAAFSPESLRTQLTVPGLHMFRGVREGQTVGVVLWFVQGQVAYYHLAAYSGIGYQTRASYAIFWAAHEFFVKKGLRWLALGSVAGLQDSMDGLARFKRGWSTGTRMAYLCGRILDPRVYIELVQSRQISGAGYFPLYRKGEVN